MKLVLYIFRATVQVLSTENVTQVCCTEFSTFQLMLRHVSTVAIGRLQEARGFLDMSSLCFN